MGAPRRALGARRARPPLHRPPPRPRGHQPAGVRRAAPRRARGAPARAHRRHRGPQRPDRATSTSRSPIRSRPARSRCCARTPPSSASRYYPMGDPGQGIVHVIGPGAGPHAARHDDRVRRQPHRHPRRVRRARLRHRHQRGRARAGHPDAAAGAAEVDGGRASTASCPPGVTAKDVILAVIGEIGTGGGIGHVIEYRGSTIRGLSMEGRMTVCNMSIEAGAQAGLVAPDDTTFAYLEGRAHAPQGAAWDEAVAEWRDAAQRRRRGAGTARSRIDADDAAPAGHVGHQPGPGHVDRRRRAVARRLRRPDDPRDGRRGRSSTWA